ncbi:MAG: hypothetical protein JWO46_2100, partial [Nocardioidaceae bacterium]|nr:hypothetical protein [Nocardioidaceae bacterium]
LPHPRAGYRGPGKRFLAERVLVAQSGRPTQVPERLRAWVEERSALIASTLRDGGYDVVGSLSDLGPDPAGFDTTDAEVTAPELVDAAAEALATILVDRADNAADVARMRTEVERLRSRVEELEPGGSGEGWRGIARDVRRRLPKRP